MSETVGMKNASVLPRITMVIVAAVLSAVLASSPARASTVVSQQSTSSSYATLSGPLNARAGETGPYVDQYYDNIGPCELKGRTFVAAHFWTHYFCAVSAAYPHSFYTLYYWLPA